MKKRVFQGEGAGKVANLARQMSTSYAELADAVRDDDIPGFVHAAIDVTIKQAKFDKAAEQAHEELANAQLPPWL